jgi:hypothetical protein
MIDLLTFGTAAILLVIATLLEWTDAPMTTQSCRRPSSPRKPRSRPRPKPRFTGNVVE